jgi:cytoskeleton protein RodZ
MSEAIERVGRSGADQAPAARLGAELRATRQSYGWELPDLAASLRIRQSYLEAIEAGRISELPGTTYALGFVRAYASALGLPGDQVASRFRAESAEAIVKPALSFPAPVPQRGVPAGALMLLGLVILAGAYSGWYYVSEHQRTPVETVPPIPDHLLPAQLEKPAPSPQVASILPSTAPPAPVSPAAMPKMIAPAGDVRPARPATPPGAPPGAPPAMAAPPALPPAGEAAAPPSGMMAAPQAAPPAARIIVKATADAWVTVKQPGGPALLRSTWMVRRCLAGLAPAGWCGGICRSIRPY